MNKRIIGFFSLFLLLFSSISQNVNAYVLNASTYQSTISSIEADKSTFDTYYNNFYNENLTLINTLKNSYNTGTMLSEMNSLYNSAYSKKSTIITNLKAQQTQLNTLYEQLNTKYQNGTINKNDYGIIKGKIDLFSNEINTAIIDIGNIDEFVGLYNLLITNVGNKLNLVNGNIKPLNDSKALFLSEKSEYSSLSEVLKISKDSTDLTKTIDKGYLIKNHMQADTVISVGLKSLKVELETIKLNLDNVKTSITDFINSLNSITNINIISTTDVSALLGEISDKELEKSKIDQLYGNLKNTSLTGNRAKISNTIYQDYLLKVKELGTVISGNNLQKISIKVPNSGYLTDLDDATTQNSNQSKLKAIMGNIKNNTISNEGLEIYPSDTTLTTNEIIFNKPIKNLLTFENSFALNVQNDLVSRINIVYTNSNGQTLASTFTSKIDMNELNVKDGSGNIITTNDVAKNLDGVYLEKDQYSIDMKLISRDAKTSLEAVTASGVENMPKDLIVNIIDSNGDTYYSKKIEDVKDFNSLSIKNIGGIKFSYSQSNDTYFIDYANFTTYQKNKIFLNNLKISFVGYAGTEYTDLESSIKTNYLSDTSNILKLDTGRTIGNKVGEVKVKINNEDTTKTISYSLLNGVEWDSATKIMKPNYKNYTIEKNVIIDPLLKRYFDDTKEVSFDEKISDIRSVMTNGSKISKIVRLQNSAGQAIVEEYRYFDSTANYNSDIDDTTGQVLIFFKINEVIAEGNPIKGINRIENVYYKIGLNENYGKVISKNNTNQLIPLSGNLTNDKKPEILTVDPVMKYKVFTDYRLYFDKDKYLAGDIKNAIRYTQIYKDDKMKYKYVKINGINVKDKGVGLTFLDTP